MRKSGKERSMASPRSSSPDVVELPLENDQAIVSPRRKSEASLFSPRRRNSLKKVMSVTVLQNCKPEVLTEVTPRKRSSFFDRTELQSKLPSATSKIEDFNRLQRYIMEQRALIDVEIVDALAKLPDGFELIKLHLRYYQDLTKHIIFERGTFDISTKNELDLYIYQQQPPYLVYLYCQSILSAKQSPFENKTVMRSYSESALSERSEQVALDPIKLEWLRTLIDSSTPGMAATLIYIATQIELAENDESLTVLFRADSLASRFSLCYANARASDYLRDLVNEVIQCMRNHAHWPLGYNIDAEPQYLDANSFNNFTAMMAGISEIITKVKSDPTISSIISLRYDLTLRFHNNNTDVASQAAISLFWLRLFIPLFRSQKFDAQELPVIKRVSTLLAKASSGIEFPVSKEKPLTATAIREQSTNTFLNDILRKFLFNDFKLCLDKVTEKKSHTMIFNFKNKSWEVFHPLLPVTADLDSTLGAPSTK